MKNIHILPTDKPSRLIIYSTLLNEFRLLDEPFEDWKHKRHIYITSDEEIKDGEYGICLNLVREGFKSHQAVFKMDAEQRQAMNELGGQKKAEVLKVILTTDQDLIKDGVQAIDNEFLEWFVKNPNCEDVEVEIICGVCGVEGREDEIDVCGRSKECARGWISDKYKIIIPRKIIQIYKINDLKEAFLKGYVAKNNKEDYPFAVQKFLNSKLNENKK